MTDSAPISTPIVDAIRAAIEAEGGQAVADRIGVQRTDLYRWLRGSGMTLANADRIAVALGLRVKPQK